MDNSNKTVTNSKRAVSVVSRSSSETRVENSVTIEEENSATEVEETPSAVVKHVMVTGNALPATTAISHHDSNAEDVTQTKMERRERRNSLKLAREIGIARFATTTTLHEERSAKSAMPTKMELLERQEVVTQVAVVVDSEGDVDLEAEVDVALQEEVEAVVVASTNHSEDSITKKKFKIRKSLSTTKIPLIPCPSVMCIRKIQFI